MAEKICNIVLNLMLVSKQIRKNRLATINENVRFERV